MICSHCGQKTPALVSHCTTCGKPIAAGVRPEIAADVATLPSDTSQTTRLPGGDSTQTPPGSVRSDTSDTTGLPPGTSRGPTRGIAGPLRPGQNFGTRYHIKKVLGVGGMGAVYRAWDKELGVAVALKVIRPDVMNDPKAAQEFERRFKRETLLARQVTHPNVVRIHDLGEIDGIKYITMPYLEGEDLASLLRKSHKLDVPAALRFVRQVVSGLQAAHEAGVVHRDLKPSNIMVVDNHAIIMDFGLARLGSASAPGTDQSLTARVSALQTSKQARVGTMVGTVKYMAPEQAWGETVDGRADIYAIGLTLRDVLLGGRQVPIGTDPLDELRQRIDQAPQSARSIDPQIPEALDRVISRCVQPNPAERYQTTAELAGELNRLDDNGNPLPILRTIRLPFVLAGGAVALALVVASWWFAPAPPVEQPPVSVLIAQFENRAGDRVFDGVLEQALGVALEAAPFINAYPTRDALAVAAQIGPGAQLDEATARLVATREGVQVVIPGAIERAGAGYRVSARLVDAATGNVVAAADAAARDRDQVSAAIGAIASDLRTALGDTTPESTRAIAAETFTAQSLEAARAYALGQEAQWAGDRTKAIEQYLEAVRLDAGLGRAYSGLAAASANLGRPEDAERYYKLALARLDRMSERERFRTRVGYYLFTRNADQAIEELRGLVTSFPADSAALANLALAYFYKRDMGRAVEEGRRAVDLVPGNVIRRNNLALFALYAGEFATAEREAAAALKLNGSFEKAFIATALAQLGQGRAGEAAQTYERLRAVSPLGATYALTGLADLALYEGRIADAVALLERGAGDDLKQGNRSAAAFKQVMLADSLQRLGRSRQARAALEEALKQSRNDSVLIAAGRTYIALRLPERALAIARELEQRVEPDPRAYAALLDGEAALAAGDARRALERLEAARKLVDTWLGRLDLGRANIALGRFAEASSDLENALKRRGEAAALFLDDVPTFAVFPPVHYYLGRVQEGLLSPNAAVESYRAFLAIKQKADPKLDSLVADALVRLKP